VEEGQKRYPRGGKGKYHTSKRPEGRKGNIDTSLGGPTESKIFRTFCQKKREAKKRGLVLKSRKNNVSISVFECKSTNLPRRQGPIQGQRARRKKKTDGSRGDSGGIFDLRIQKKKKKKKYPGGTFNRNVVKKRRNGT